MCVHCDSITNGINYLFMLYIFSEEVKGERWSLLYVIWSSRKETFFCCNGFNTIQIVLPGWSCNTKDLEIGFSAMIHVELLLSLLPCLCCPSDLRPGVPSLQPRPLGASSSAGIRLFEHVSTHKVLLQFPWLILGLWTQVLMDSISVYIESNVGVLVWGFF